MLRLGTRPDNARMSAPALVATCSASPPVVKGVGIAAFYELDKHGMLVAASSTSVATYYKLRVA